MDKKGGGEEKFSNHPCHRLSVPAAKRFWCRHCFEMFDDPISRWRHSKACKNTGLSNMTRRKEQEATALEAYCESTLQKKPEDSKHVILPNLNPRSTNKSYIGPKENSAVDLSCFICNKQFSTMEEMKDHVRVPCNKVVPVTDDFPFATQSTPKPSTSEIIYHGETDGQGTSSTVYEFGEDGSLSKKRTPSPLDPSNLSSETMAAVEALNMMARSDKVNLTQFLNQLSEGGFVIEQAAGSSTASDSQDREIVFTVQGDAGESGDLLQHGGGDITVEVAEDLIRMAQRVRVEAVERVVEEQVQEEVVQEDLEQAEVRYIQVDQAAPFMQGQPQFVEEQTEYVEQTQYVEEQLGQLQEEQEQLEQTVLIQGEQIQQQTEFVQAEPPLAQEQVQYLPEQPESEQPSTYTIMNVETGKEITGHIVTQGQLSNVRLDSLQENAQVLAVPIDEDVVTKKEPEDLPSIPDGKRKLEEEESVVDGVVQVKLENGSQVKKICTEVVLESIVPDCSVKEEVFEAKKKLQFFNEGLIVQEKCNKNSKTTEKKLGNKFVEPCDVENSSKITQDRNLKQPVQTPDLNDCRTFLDEVDGTFKPMTEEMIKTEENILDMCTLMTVESTSPEEKMTELKPKPTQKYPSPSPKKLRSSSRKLVLTPKKKKLLEDREKRRKTKPLEDKTIKKSENEKELKCIASKLLEHVVKTEPEPESESQSKKSPEIKPVERKPKMQPPKQLKCRICERVFNSLKSLNKHKSVPCVVKITRNLCQKILRPKRALPKPPEKKVVKKKVVKHVKDLKKPKLLPVGFCIQAQWIPCKRERKSSKGRGRPRKHSVHYERKKTIILPDKTIEISSLSEKEQFFFELGLVCSDYVSEEFRRPLPEPEVKVMTSLTVSVENDESENVRASEISPPLLERMEPTDITILTSEQLPDLEEELEPPQLEPALPDLKESVKDSLTHASSTEDSFSESGRHFLDSLSENVATSVQCLVDQVVNSVEGTKTSAAENAAIENNKGLKVESPKQGNIFCKLKSKLKNVCSPEKPSPLSSIRKLEMPDITNISPNSSPNPKRNLFEMLQTCSTETKATLTNTQSPNTNVSSLCNSAIDDCKMFSRKFTPSPRKCSSTHSSPKKTPNILRRRSFESGCREETDGILDIVAKSMGIAGTESGGSQAQSARSSLTEKAEKSSKDGLSPCKKNLFENCESLLQKKSSKQVSADVVEKVRSKVLGKSKHLDSALTGNANKSSNVVKPLVSLSSSQTGQILVSPIKRNTSGATTRSNHRGMKRKLCDASTQCERVARSSPVTVMLGHLEHRLKLLKSALKSQTHLKTEAEASCEGKMKENKNLLPELVSVILNGSSEVSTGQNEHRCSAEIEDLKKNLPDVVRSVTENKLVFDQSNALKVDPISKEDPSQLSSSGGSTSVMNEDSSDLFSESEMVSTCSEDSDGSDKVKVQYINQLEPGRGNGVTYLLIQQEGMEDYLTSCLSADLEAGETIHAVTVEEEELHAKTSRFSGTNVSRTVDREVFVNSSGF